MTYQKRPRGRATCSINGCAANVKGHGLCDKHYQRARKAGALVVPPPKTEWERFWEKVEIGDCWEWQGAKIDGYGWFGRKDPGSNLTHRWTWERLVGPVPEGLDLDHLCRNRACCNPDHLEPVTRRVNLLRGATLTAAAASAEECPHGHPYDESNTGYQARTGYRFCKTCVRANRRARYLRERSQK